MYRCNLIQDGIVVASVQSTDWNRARCEINHYAQMYGMDGDVRIVPAPHSPKQSKPEGRKPVIKLTMKTRDDLKSLLLEHQLVTDALAHVSQASWASNLTVSNEGSGDYVEVPMRHTIAKEALSAQRAWLESELKKLGIDIG